MTWDEIKLLLGIPGVKRKVIFTESQTFVKVMAEIHGVVVHTSIVKGSTDFVEWEANYKSFANRPITNRPPFASKEVDEGSLFSRPEGQQFSILVGNNTLEYVIPYPHMKFDGLEILGGEKKDKATLKIVDDALGTYSTVPNLILNTFGTDVNIHKDKYEKKSEYDADLYQGMRIVIEYSSVSAKDIEINYSLHEVK